MSTNDMIVGIVGLLVMGAIFALFVYACIKSR
jgi:hypothetical protein